MGSREGVGSGHDYHALTLWHTAILPVTGSIGGRGHYLRIPVAECATRTFQSTEHNTQINTCSTVAIYAQSSCTLLILVLK